MKIIETNRTDTEALYTYVESKLNGSITFDYNLQGSLLLISCIIIKDDNERKGVAICSSLNSEEISKKKEEAIKNALKDFGIIFKLVEKLNKENKKKEKQKNKFTDEQVNKWTNFISKYDITSKKRLNELIKRFGKNINKELTSKKDLTSSNIEDFILFATELLGDAEQ
jgi:Na+/phosphate symporter